MIISSAPPCAKCGAITVAGGACPACTPPQRYSPTQVSMYRTCRRKWFFQYVLGFKPPQSQSQIVGSEIHRHIECALKDGVLPNDDRALAAIKELARIEAAGDLGLEARLQAIAVDPKSYLEAMSTYVESKEIAIERDIDIALTPSPIDGAPRSFVGVIDLYDGRKKQAVITDHKTTSDLKYAKTPYELAEDVQMISYAYWALAEPLHAWTEQDKCTVRHLVIPTRGAARAVPVEAELEREHVTQRWSSYLPIIDEMDLLRRSADPIDAPPDGFNNGECERFGGCPHKTRCAGAIFRLPTTGENQMTNEVQARIAALRAKTGAGPTPPAAQPVVPMQTQVLQAPQLPENHPQQSQAFDHARAPAPVAAPAAAPSASDRMAKLRAIGKGAAAPAAPAPTAPAAAPAPAQGAPIDIRARIAQMQQPAAPVPASAPVAAPADLAQQITHVYAQANPVLSPASVPSKRIEILFLDCAPTTGMQAARLEVWAAPILETIKAQTGLAWQHHEYRRGPGLVADGIAVTAPPPYLVVDTSTALGKVALEALLPLANVVVQGRAA